MSTTDSPNILFVITDQQRYDWIGTDPDVPVRTPNIDSLAEEGVDFSNAVCPAPLCGPSRTCLASGMEYDEIGIEGNDDYPFDLLGPTCYGRLRDEAGYETIGVGDIDLHNDSPIWIDTSYGLDSEGFSDGVEIPGKRAMRGTYRFHLEEDCHLVDVEDAEEELPPGLDPGHDVPADPYTTYLQERGILEEVIEDWEDRLYSDRPVSNYATTRPAPVSEEDYVDNWVGRHGLDFLESAPEDQPWFLFVNFVGPHEPLDVTEEMHGWYRDPDIEFPDPVAPDDELDAETHQEIRRNYAAMCENFDQWLGEYLDVLEDRGEREDTIIVFTSDHGEMLGDHGRWAKGVPRHPSVGVPLIVAGPGIEARGRIDEPVSTLDLHATVLEYAGLDPGDVDSRSLCPYLEGETDDHRDVVQSGMGKGEEDWWRLAFDGRYKLIAAGKEHADEYDPPVLFDLESDPGEQTDVADDYPDVVDRLIDHLPERTIVD